MSWFSHRWSWNFRAWCNICEVYSGIEFSHGLPVFASAASRETDGEGVFPLSADSQSVCQEAQDEHGCSPGRQKDGAATEAVLFIMSASGSALACRSTQHGP